MRDKDCEAAETDRQTDRHRETEAERDRDRQTGTETETELLALISGRCTCLLLPQDYTARGFFTV